MLVQLANRYIRASNHRGKHLVLKRLARLVDGRPLRSRYGPVMRLRAKDYTSFTSVTGCGPWIHDYDDVYAEVAALSPGMAFLDVGANAGLFSLVASKAVGESGVVIAFEPSPDMFAQLVENIALNRARNIFPFNAALADATKLARFRAGKTHHTGAGHLDESGDSTVLQLSFADITAVIQAIAGERELVIKIDVEGAEGLIVDSIRELLHQKSVTKVVIEIDPRNLARFGSTAEGIYAAFADAGFRPRRGLGSAAHYNELFDR